MISPEEIIKGKQNQRYQQANRAYQTEAQMLRQQGLPSEVMRQESAKLVQKFQGLKLQIDSETEDQLFQINTINNLVQSGQVNPEAGEEAGFRRTVGGDVAGAMFEKDKGSDMLRNYATLDIHRKRIQSRLDRYMRPKRPTFTKKERLLGGYGLVGELGTAGTAPTDLKVITETRTVKGTKQHQTRPATEEEQREHANLLTQRSRLDQELSGIARQMNVDPTSIGQLSRVGEQKINRTPITRETGGPLQAGIKKQVAPAATPQTVRVVSPDGKQGSIPASQLDEALAAGYRKI